MKDITEFKAWFNNEISQYPLIAKSNPLSLNELCYVLRQSGRDSLSAGPPIPGTALCRRFRIALSRQET